MVRKYKPRVIPEQDRRICGSICLCQLTIVLSCVSLVYLSVAIYMPANKAFNSGFETEPVMCQTIDTTMANSCDWASCGEWCLTKTTGFCPQITVTVRRNATDMLLENCTKISSVSCPQVYSTSLKKYNCNNGTQCSTLTGVFNCSLGHCANMSELYQCHHKADGIVVDSDQDNMKLNGFFDCLGSRCVKIRKPFTCDRFCPKITTTGQNVYVLQDDNLWTAECQRAMALTETHGSERGGSIPPTHIWDEQGSGGFLITTCHTVVKEGDQIRGTDCLNGTVIEEVIVPQPFINFTTFWSLYENNHKQAHPVFLPPQSSLTIYNHSRLYINLEGCVNTLRGECKDFLGTHGRDGDNHTAQSNFPCYYNPNNSFMVVARFDLQRTWLELMVAIIVPSVLFVISFITLCIITQSVKVGDDAKMRCRCCRRRRKQEESVEDLNHGESNHDDFDADHERIIRRKEPKEEEEELGAVGGESLSPRRTPRIQLSPCNDDNNAGNQDYDERLLVTWK